MELKGGWLGLLQYWATAMNPFNGIERTTCPDCCATTLPVNPFNGIERPAGTPHPQGGPREENPFNGIESLGPDGHEAPSFPGHESIQWN